MREGYIARSYTTTEKNRRLSKNYQCTSKNKGKEKQPTDESGVELSGVKIIIINMMERIVGKADNMWIDGKF